MKTLATLAIAIFVSMSTVMLAGGACTGAPANNSVDAYATWCSGNGGTVQQSGAGLSCTACTVAGGGSPAAPYGTYVQQIMSWLMTPSPKGPTDAERRRIALQALDAERGNAQRRLDAAEAASLATVQQRLATSDLTLKIASRSGTLGLKIGAEATQSLNPGAAADATTSIPPGSDADRLAKDLSQLSVEELKALLARLTANAGPQPTATPAPAATLAPKLGEPAPPPPPPATPSATVRPPNADGSRFGLLRFSDLRLLFPDLLGFKPFDPADNDRNMIELLTNRPVVQPPPDDRLNAVVRQAVSSPAAAPRSTSERDLQMAADAVMGSIVTSNEPITEAQRRAMLGFACVTLDRRCAILSKIDGDPAFAATNREYVDQAVATARRVREAADSDAWFASVKPLNDLMFALTPKGQQPNIPALLNTPAFIEGRKRIDAALSTARDASVSRGTLELWVSLSTWAAASDPVP